MLWVERLGFGAPGCSGSDCASGRTACTFGLATPAHARGNCTHTARSGQALRHQHAFTISPSSHALIHPSSHAFLQSLIHSSSFIHFCTLVIPPAIPAVISLPTPICEFVLIAAIVQPTPSLTIHPRIHHVIDSFINHFIHRRIHHRMILAIQSHIQPYPPHPNQGHTSSHTSSHTSIIASIIA